ncbi:hypothetical protein DMH04_55455 [Kibdelosporangium aridum]|uniref:Uncharacterized protein n=1 Tax=Kibdelosporangium aridum TaxID=2030 RepID=A0A428XWF9_KIBAR|nr:hypothetical protein DMH04_55455 [Kibdelosporangium aridum]
MVGSPNAGHFVYDGDDSDGVGSGPGPTGSGPIEAAFAARFAAAGVPTEGKDFIAQAFPLVGRSQVPR